MTAEAKKVKITLVIIFLLLIIVVLGFTGLLNVNSFQKNYTDSLVSSYAVVGRETVRKIEYAVKYGKPLDNFLGIEELLGEVKEDLPEIDNVYIVLRDGAYIYDIKGSVRNQQLTYELTVAPDFDPHSSASYQMLLKQEKYHLMLPIKAKDEKVLGYMDIVFHKTVVNEAIQENVQRLVYSFIVLAAIGGLILLLFNNTAFIISREGRVNRKKFITVIFILLGILQIIYGCINYTVLRNAYIEIATENINAVSRIVQNDIQSVINKGVPYSKFYKIEDYMKNIIEVVPEIQEISIVDEGNDVIFRTTHIDIDNRQTMETPYSFRFPLVEDIENARYSLQVELSNGYLKNRMQEIILDVLTIFVTSIFFMVEITFFILKIFEKKISRREDIGKYEGDIKEVDTSIVRPLSFLLFIALFMPNAFIPVMMQEIYKPILGLSKNVIIGLPISVNFLFGAIATIIAGILIDKKGWRRIFIIGVVFFSIGTFFSGFTASPSLFILSRGIAGAGYGFLLMALRGFVLTNPMDKREGLAALNSGLYSGINCGVVVGAMLADRVGYSQVFYWSILVIILSAIFAVIFVPNINDGNKSKDLEKKVNGCSLKTFLSNRQVFSYFLLILIPTAICSMFLDYFFPIFAKEAGISLSNIGRAFLINGLCIVYLGPILSQSIGKYFNDKKSMLIGCMLVVGGLMIFTVNATLVTAFIGVFLLGIADSFGLVAQTNYFLGLKASVDLGQGQALGYYSNVKKVGQMLGPFIFGSFLGFGNKIGVGIIAVTTGGALLLFIALSLSDKSPKDHQQYQTEEG